MWHNWAISQPKVGEFIIVHSLNHKNNAFGIYSGTVSISGLDSLVIDGENVNYVFTQSEFISVHWINRPAEDKYKRVLSVQSNNNIK